MARFKAVWSGCQGQPPPDAPPPLAHCAVHPTSALDAGDEISPLKSTLLFIAGRWEGLRGWKFPPGIEKNINMPVTGVMAASEIPPQMANFQTFSLKDLFSCQGYF